jgi:ATP-dependent exoDNAse (exonuclease V) alpha subunit
MFQQRNSPDRKIDNLEMNDEFLDAFEAMENTRKHVFITGKAGTGKSTLLKYFKDYTKKNTVVLAPTGVAAINVHGQTVHSFFGFPPRFIQKSAIRWTRNKEIIQRLDTIVIDEVSMLRADIMDGIDHVLKNIRGVDEPFGGVQMIFFGDLFQLAPVIERAVLEIMRDKYESPYFFDSEAYSLISPRYIELTKIYRQVDKAFVEILNRVRRHEETEKDMARLNENQIDRIPDNLNGAVVLTSTNDLAAGINRARLAKLRNQEHIYEAAIDGEFDDNFFATDRMLRLKIGAQVMMMRNDPDKRWVNGTIGEVAELSGGAVKVRIEGSVYEVEQVGWEKIRYEYNRLEDKIEEQVVGTFKQYPLKLAWAITIHKSQGQTFDDIIIDLGFGAFAHGQVYVALSRCTSLAGVRLMKRIRSEDIIFDERIYNFAGRFPRELF